MSKPGSPRPVLSSARSIGRLAAVLAAGLLGACVEAPPLPPPVCPTALPPASAPPPTATAAPSASAPAAEPAQAQMQKPKDAAEAGFCTKDELKAAHDELDA